MSELPDGVVTFLFTDVEGSTALWAESPDSMMDALERHDTVIDDAATANGGISVKPRGEGDSRFVVFRSANEALAAVVAMQQGLAHIDWPTPRPLRVRMALHTGAADLQLGDYYGPTVNRTARLRAIAHGGQTVISRATRELVQDTVPTGVTIRDMGRHGLKDLTRPEHVYQVDIDGLPDEFPPLASLDAVPNNLPVQLTDFVGRQTELDAAVQIVGKKRLLTILAPGGSGKTRLAIQLAARVLDDFPDGVFFVDLAPISSAADIVQTVAESIGIAVATDDEPLDSMLAYLATKRQLLVFDNFEHVTDGVAIIPAILGSAPDVKVIATSRTKLNITGETVLTLAGLITEWETPGEAMQVSGVELFVDAAQRADPSFALSPEDLEPLRRILTLVDGMPLGILLAAAWVDTLPVAEIATEIAGNLDFLESEMSDLPDRQRSIRAVFDYSWAMLGESERRGFSALSVFRGGFTREAAEAVAGASIRNLSNLASKSLLVSDRSTGRYRIHELLRQYAAASLEEATAVADGVLQAHAEFFAGIGATAEELFMSARHKQAVEIVERDLDNVRTAFRYALSMSDADTASRFAPGLWFLYEMRGWIKAGADLFAEGLATLDERQATADHLRAVMMSFHASFLAQLGRLDSVVEQAAAAAATLKNDADRRAYIRALEAQCECLTYAGLSQDVAAVAREAIAVAEAAGEDLLAGGMRNYVALSDLMSGDLETAAHSVEAGDAVLAPAGEHFMRTWNLAIQSSIATMRGDFDEAVALSHRQLDLARDIGYRRGIQVGCDALGAALLKTGDLDAANTAYIEALAMSDQMGAVRETADELRSIAGVRAEMGQPEIAVRLLACAIASPKSDQMSDFATGSSIRDLAEEALDSLRKTLDADAFAAAHAAGSATSVAVAANELLSS